jgi:uncharacterized membrane protein YozB (DUF420 family)
MLIPAACLLPPACCFVLAAGWVAALPHFNAVLNFSSFVLLLSGYFFIRRKNIIAHRNCQIAALSVSILFLISYLTYHSQHGATRFQGQGIVRPVYFTILTTHTILAVVIVPFVIITFRRARRGDFLRHRAIAPLRVGLCRCGCTFQSPACWFT